MKAPLSLRKPTNWQDFESLCKRLWGEIWDCHEIQKNGRGGQTQYGIDIYGIPKDEKQYYGIQCKGKDEYTDKQFTRKEIEDAIEDAKNFKPALKKLYLATTAVKDATTEQFIREKNLEHIEKGLFEIHLFSWEDIVDLIEANRGTFEYYVRSSNYIQKKSVKVTFQNGSSTLIAHPKFKQNITTYEKWTYKSAAYDKVATMVEAHRQFTKNFESLNRFKSIGRVSFVSRNLSFFPVQVLIHNSGFDSIENLKFFLQFQGKIVSLKNTNVDGPLANLFDMNHHSNTRIDEKNLAIEIVPYKQILVGDDTIHSEKVFIKPLPEYSSIKGKWKLISNEFKDEGELLIEVDPDIVRKYHILNVEDQREKEEAGEILDFIESNDDDSENKN